MGLGAFAMPRRSVSGSLLVARRARGWRRWFAPLKVPLAARIHVELARLAVPALGFPALTALRMTASTFGLIAEGTPPPAIPSRLSGLVGASLATMPELVATPVSDLRALAFPFAGSATDVFTLTRATGSGARDEGTGATPTWEAQAPLPTVSETICNCTADRAPRSSA